MIGRIRNRVAEATALVLLFGSVVAPGLGQCELAEFRGDAPDDAFGYAVAVSGDRAVMRCETLVEGQVVGAVCIVEPNGATWSRVATLIADDARRGTRFANALDVSANRVAAGAAGDDDQALNAGAAYLFEYSGGAWTQVAKLVANDAIEGAFFGDAVAISSDYVVVGAPSDDEAGFRSGSAYVFERQLDETWLQVGKLVGHDTVATDHFGNAVAIDGDVIVVGAWDDDDLGWGSGSAYVFERSQDSSWSQVAKLLADDGDVLDGFGYGAAVDDGVALIGSYAANGIGYDDGAVYVYQRTGSAEWPQVGKLFAADGSDVFGCSVDLDGGVAVIGARGNDDHGVSSGAAYVFVRNTDESWSEVAKLVPDDGLAWDHFGWAVGVSGNVGVIGTFPNDINNDPIPGKAYLYAVGPDDDGDGIMDACECPGDLNADWIVDQSDLGILLGDWGCASGECPGDADADGDTDHADLGLLLAYWGEVCP